MDWFEEKIYPFKKQNYVLKADSKSNYWFGLSKNRIDSLIKTFGNEFNIVLKGSDIDETDFYVIPYSMIRDLLVDKNLYLINKRKRWVGDIKNHILRIRNSDTFKDISNCHRNPGLLVGKNEKRTLDDMDYSIENFKREVSIRQKQYMFRREVLQNFDGMCCLTTTMENDLLVASHIIPWSANIKRRLDPSNGLCLSVLYDKLFDSGYFTIDSNFKVVISNKISLLSDETKFQLRRISKTKMKQPIYHNICVEALKFHRENIFKKY